MSIFSLSERPTTTDYLMLFFHHPKACVPYLYISSFYDLQAINVPKCLWHGVPTTAQNLHPFIPRLPSFLGQVVRLSVEN
jgi:hypothetical protein